MTVPTMSPSSPLTRWASFIFPTGKPTCRGLTKYPNISISKWWGFDYHPKEVIRRYPRFMQVAQLACHLIWPSKCPNKVYLFFPTRNMPLPAEDLVYDLFCFRVEAPLSLFLYRCRLLFVEILASLILPPSFSFAFRL